MNVKTHLWSNKKANDPVVPRLPPNLLNTERTSATVRVVLSVSVSTKMVYEKLDSCEIKEHPDIDGILDGLKNQDLEQVAASLGNVLEKVTVEAYPVIAQIKECMMEAGALGAMMSGSGPTVFGIFRDRRTAKEAFTKVKAQNLAKQIYLANVHNVRRR